MITGSPNSTDNEMGWPDFSKAEAQFQEATLQAQLETIRRAEERTNRASTGID